MSTEKIEAKATVKVEFKINFELSLIEAEALEAISGYGAENFLQYFYEKLGKSYLSPHEKGVISLFATIKKELPTEIGKIKKAAKAINVAITDFNNGTSH